jgi:putative ABC transport system substrate-binding protein
VRRRDFITLLGGATATWPRSARAQPGDKVRRVGALLHLSESDAEAKAWMAAFEQGLQQLGWTPGRNIRIDYRWGGGDQALLSVYAAELVRTVPDVLFAAPTPALAALHRETYSLPIVFVQVADPVKLGFVETLARPGGNITGFTTYEFSIGGKWLELIRDTAPGVVRVLVIFEPDNPSQPSYLEAIDAAAPTFRVELSRAGVHNTAEIERAINAFAQEPNGALIVAPSAVSISYRDLILALATRHRLPAICPYRVFASGGGLISYGVDLVDSYRRAASYVDLILKGAKPGDLPVQLPTKFELVVNLKTAKTLGLTIPEPFLQHADEVIE